MLITKMIALRTQLEVALRNQQHNDSIAYDSNAEKQQSRKFDLIHVDSQSRKFDLLHVDLHFFNKSTFALSFVSFVFSSIKRFVISTFINSYHIKYSDIDDFYDDREKWKQWKENLLTKIWTCSLQFSIEQHKINYTRRHTKKTAYDIIKTRARIDSENLYSTIDELLKNLNDSFDENENIKQSKVYVKLFDDKFRMIEIEKFEIFITRYIAIIVDLQIIDEILIYQLKLKLSFALRYFIDHLTETHKYHEFVNDLRYIAQHVEELKVKRSEIKSKSYSSFYSLTRRKKKHLDVERVCYKCNQSKHKISDKNASCKHTSWMLKKNKAINRSMI